MSSENEIKAFAKTKVPRQCWKFYLLSQFLGFQSSNFRTTQMAPPLFWLARSRLKIAPSVGVTKQVLKRTFAYPVSPQCIAVCSVVVESHSPQKSLSQLHFVGVIHTYAFKAAFYFSLVRWPKTSAASNYNCDHELRT